MLFANSQTAVGSVALFIAIVMGVGYAFINIRNSRAEVGSEIELAPNRKPYYTDEELEGTKLTRTLTMGMIGMLVIAVTLPLYWLAEPGRQAGAVKNVQAKFISRGSQMFAPTAAGGFNCAFCHNGMDAEGGSVTYTITDSTGAYIKTVNWYAPALNTVLLRYSRADVEYVLTYGRPFSPMPAWGIAGGGPLDSQQIENLVDYLETIQITPAQSQAAVVKELATERKMKNPDGTLKYPKSTVSDGELLFNLGYDDGFAGGAYACGRCHTTNWSEHDKTADGTGAMGPALRNGDTLNRFPGSVLGPVQQRDFICAGSQVGKLYGVNGQGTGRMPAFCQTPAEVPDEATTGEVGVEPKQVEEIVAYERSL
jgi:hypothetical protein